MKIKKTEKKARPLKLRLTVSFILFAVILMGIIWILQIGFLTKYYEISMDSKVENAINSIELKYGENSLTYDDFCDYLGEISGKTDIQFFVEATDGSFRISSSDVTLGGRIFSDSFRFMSEAYDALLKTDTGKTSLVKNLPNGSKTIVHAKLVQTQSKVNVIIFAIASLTPIGPAVSILRSELFIITIAALILCVFVARLLSKRLAKPISGLGEQAKDLAKGNYDITFNGGHDFLEIDELADTLTETAAELKKTDSLQKDLMANVSHDIRTPLTMIKSYAEMIRDLSGDNPDKREQHLGVIIEETDRLSDLVNDVLTLSKMQAGVIDMKKEKFDIQKSAESVLSTYLVMEQEGYSFKYNCIPEDIFVLGDERKIQQVMSNLISNAIRYSEDNKNIEISFSDTIDKVRFSVADNGIGIPKEDIDKIWHRYEKASTKGQRSKEGSGLGLSISAEILGHHNALYGVESEEGKGSTFWFELQKA